MLTLFIVTAKQNKSCFLTVLLKLKNHNCKNALKS